MPTINHSRRRKKRGFFARQIFRPLYGFVLREKSQLNQGHSAVPLCVNPRASAAGKIPRPEKIKLRNRRCAS
jgi:hypothetical protein